MAITRSERRQLVSRNSDLPLDLVSDILSRLHVKPLLKFKSASKIWFTLIQNPTFIKTHLNRLKNHNIGPLEESMLVVINIFRKNSMYLQFGDGNGTTYESVRILFRDFISVDGMCDGLVCANLYADEPIIFNPAIGKICRISLPGLPIERFDVDFSAFGLLESDGYSLFRIVYSHSPSGNVVLRGEVYSMRTDTWRLIEVKRGGEIDPHVYIQSNMSMMPVELDRVFYWHAYGSRRGYVVSFNTCENMFMEIPWPVDYSVEVGRAASKIIDFKGEPAMPVAKGLLQEFDLWVLDVKRRSWTKKFMLGDLSRIGQGVNFLSCARNGKLVLQHRGRKLVSYDPESLEIEDLPFHHGEDGGEVFYSFYSYTSSLISV